MKRFMSFFAAFIMILSIFLNIFCYEVNAAPQKIVVDDFDVLNTDVIYKGEEFNFSITLRNTDEISDVDDVKLKIVQKSFQRMGGTSVIDFGTIGAGETKTETFALKYVGGSNVLDLTINYDGGSGVSDSIAIDEAMNYENDSDTSTDTTKYKPEVLITNQEMPVATSGKEFKLDLQFKNEGKHMAKNVLIFAEVEENSPFITNNLISSKTLDKISSTTSEDVSFLFNVKSSAQPGIYPIKIKYQYDNAYKDTFPSDGKFIEQTVLIKVTEGYVYYEPIIKEIITNPETIQSGEDAELTIRIANDGIYDLEELKVTLEGLDAKIFTLSDDFNTKSIYKLKALSSDNTVSFKIYAYSKMEEGNYPLKIKLEYEDKDHNTKILEKEFYLKVKSKDEENISIENIVFPQEELIPGQPFDISFDVVNNGEGESEDLTVSINGGDEIIPKSQSVQNVDELKAGEKKKLIFKLQPIKNAEAKNHLINIDVKNNNNETVKTTNQYIGVEVGMGTELIISNMQSPNEAISPNEAFNVSFDIENLGIATAENISVSVDCPEGIICKSQSIQNFNILKSKEKQNLNFILQAGDKMESNNYPISIKVQYDNNKEDVIIMYTGVYVEQNESSKSIPKIIVNKYNCGNSFVKAGEEFDLNLSFLNTSSTNYIKNLKVTFSVQGVNNSDTVFIPVNRGNSIFIGEIKCNTDVEKSITMYTAPDVEARIYTVAANFEYQDEEGNQFNDKELINISVTQQSNLEIRDVSISKKNITGNQIPIEVDFYNRGNSMIKNLLISIEGNFTAQNGDYYVGNFDAGKSDTYDAMLIPTKSGNLEGVITFSYDEVNGEHKEIKKEFSTMAAGGNNENNQMMNSSKGDFKNRSGKDAKAAEELEGTKKSKTFIYLFAVISVIVVGIGIINIKRKRKGMTIDE